MINNIERVLNFVRESPHDLLAALLSALIEAGVITAEDVAKHLPPDERQN